MNFIDEVMDPYIELETAVHELMDANFSESCALCTSCCCRADVCEETIVSAFLSALLEKQNRTEKDLDDRIGWLDTTGCTLAYGRPPICYTYFCGDILSNFPDDESVLVAKTLGRLIEFVGENALNDWHLTEIVNPDDLEEVSADEILQRIEIATEALEVIEGFIKAGRLTAVERETLELIGTSEEDE